MADYRIRQNFRGGKLSQLCAKYTSYSLENFRGASGRGHHVLYTASDLRGKLSRSTEKLQKPQKFSPSKVLPYTVFDKRLIHWSGLREYFLEIFVGG